MTQLSRGGILIFEIDNKLSKLKIPNLLDGMGFVYIIEFENNTIKIGKTKNPEQRIGQLIRNAPIDAKKICLSPMCSNYSNLENLMHKRFGDKRQKCEFFKESFNCACTFLKTLDFEIDRGKQLLINKEKNEKMNRFHDMILNRELF